METSSNQAVTETVQSTVPMDTVVTSDNLVIDAGDIGSTVTVKADHTCELCHRTFTNKKDFLLHQYHHKEKSSYYCAFCFKNFTSEFAFKKHNKIHEKKKAKMVLCTICKANFEYVKDLEEHHRKFHLNQKMYRCERCEATFSWRENLNKHMRMHSTPTVTHKCEHCGKKFMDNTSLRLHSCPKKQEAQKQDKPYVCKLCDKAFQFDFSFRAHMNSHEGPIAISAWKNVQNEKMKQKSLEAKAAAERQLLAVKKKENKEQTPAMPGYTNQVCAQNTTELTSDVGRENLKEIVLEIVNVNELPSGDMTQQGAQILAQGPKPESMDPQTSMPGSHLNTTGLVARINLENPSSPIIPNQDPRMAERIAQSVAIPQVAPLAVIDPMQLSNAAIVSAGSTSAMTDVPAPAMTNQVIVNPMAQFPLPVQQVPEPVPEAEPEPQIIEVEDLVPTNASSNTPTTTTMVPVVVEEREQEPEEDEITPAPPLFSGVVGDPSDENNPEKKTKRPLLYEYIMTEEKPFQCPQCLKEFRWEISLNIHLQEHMGGINKAQRNRKLSKKTPQMSAVSTQTSKIVRRRASSDDEDDDFDHPDFLYEGATVVKRKRGRPRKYPVEAEQPKRKRGRPPKNRQNLQDPLIQQLENTTETVVIRVTRGNGENQYSIRQENEKMVTGESSPAVDDMETEESSQSHIPRHQLIRFYLLRQLKLSRYRGFYPCRFCSKPFSSKASLNMHILRHTGKGSYLCRHCGQKFPDHRTLVLHRLIEEEDEENLGPHQCSTCCRECHSAAGLQRHLQRHLPTVWPDSRPRIKHSNS